MPAFAGTNGEGSQPFTPPILQTSFHSSAVTGCTDSREYFISAMSLSFGSCLDRLERHRLAAPARRALTSTTTHGSPGSAVGSG